MRKEHILLNSPLSMWRVTLDRMRADWPIVGAAWLITLLATSLLAAGPIYSTAVSAAGLHRVLADAPVAAANIGVGVRSDGEAADAVDAEVSRVLREALGPDAAIVFSGESTSFALPGAGAEEVPDLTSIAFAEGLEGHVTLLAGEWPSPGAPASGPLGVAVSEQVAAVLDVAVGDELALVGRVGEATELHVRIGAVYRIDDPSDPFWWQDDGVLAGVERRGAYRTIGPLFVARQSLLRTPATAASLRLTWHAFPAFERLPVDQINDVRGPLGQLQDRVAQALPGTQPTVSTRLDTLLAESERSLLVSRTGVLLLVVQLAVMAAYAIVLTAGLLVEHRRVQTSLLRARGAGMRQVASLAMLEGVLLAVPAVALAPWLATAAIHLLNVAGPLAAIGLQVEPRVASDAYLAAAAAGIGCIALLVIPAAAAARLFAEEQSGLSRAETRTIGQRVGIDFALLAITVLGFWQLRLYGAPLTTSVRGTLGLDPLLVAAPAIGLLAGGVLALRIVPLLAGVVEDAVSRGRDLVAALGAWQVARRPLRYTRAALLLMLAMSMGTFAVSYAATWTRSQQDQAGFQAGADVRVSPRLGAIPSWAQGNAYRAVAGVESAMPVHRQDVNFGRAVGIGELVALPPEAAGTVNLRPDLAAAPLTSVLSELTLRRPEVALLALPQQAARLRITADVEIEALFMQVLQPGGTDTDLVRVDLATLEGSPILGASVVLRDADGLLHRFTGERTALADGEEQVTVSLALPGVRGGEGWSAERLAQPISLVAIDLAMHLPGTTLATEGRIGLVGVEASSAPSGDDAWQAVRLGRDSRWTPLLAPGDQQAGELPAERREGLAMLIGPSTTLMSIRLTNNRPTVLSFVAAPVQALASTELPVVVNQAFSSATGAQPGDDALVTLDGEPRRLQVVGNIGAFPTTDTTRPLALADGQTLALMRFQAARQATAPDEWWLRTSPGSSQAVATAVSQAPLSAVDVVSRDDRARALSTDPVALGIIGALTVGFAVAGLFAVIGLAVSAAVSARERRTEFALLRALGLSAGQLSRWLWLENVALLLISLVAGTALGLAIAWAALPFITVTQRGSTPVPSVIVEVPWTSIAVLEVVSLVALIATVVVLAGILRRIGIGSVLRMGED